MKLGDGLMSGSEGMCVRLIDSNLVR